MKLLLSLIGATSIIAPLGSSLVSCGINGNSTNSKKTNHKENATPINPAKINKIDNQLPWEVTSLTDILKVLNVIFNPDSAKFVNNDETEKLFSGLTGDLYETLVAPESWANGQFIDLQQSASIIGSFVKTTTRYINHADTYQEWNTMELSSVWNTNYDISLETPDIFAPNGDGMNIGINLPNITKNSNINFNFSKDSNNEWNYHEIFSKPTPVLWQTQKIMAAPWSTLIGYLKYDAVNVIHAGVAQFKMNLNYESLYFPTIYFDDGGHYDYMTWNEIKTLDLFDLLIDHGVGNVVSRIGSNKGTSSLFAVDDLSNPTKAIINMPMQYQMTTPKTYIEWHSLDPQN